MEESGRLKSMGSLESDTTKQLHFHFSLSCIGEGNGNPLQCSCLENPRDGEAWWAAVYGVTQSWTRLKWLSSSSSSRGEELTCWKRPWCWERLKAGEEDNRGWHGWMASPTWWTWVSVGSGSRWWTGKPGMLQSMGSQRTGDDWVTELNWSERDLLYHWSCCSWCQLSCCSHYPPCWLNPGITRCELWGWKDTGGTIWTACTFILSWVAQQP